MQISTIGIDIGKNSFHVVGFDARGGIVVRRQCSRTQLIRALANLPPCLVGMEACCNEAVSTEKSVLVAAVDVAATDGYAAAR